ncbi:two-component system OmpR family response regulator [Nocardioides zeae]|uniref:Two-component system OmpR family response regulator n=1 Tax=Nocardioides zeae TaxID=1457234 RepID=A0AAJ1U5Z8_9ACTN|nr:two-component system OmpR family response regulator [Nocardioides zeae]
MCPVGETALERSGPVALVVDPDVEDALWVAGVLQASGFEVLRADDAVSALVVAEAHAPDLVMVDAQLGAGADGIEVARRLRARSTTFIVLHSDRDDELDIVRGLSAGADAYLLRPLSGRELKVRIAAVMRRPADRFVRPAVDGGPVPASTAVAVPPAPSAAPSAAVPAAAAAVPVEPVGVDYEDGWVVFGPLRVHPDDAVAVVDDRPVALNPRAFDLLEVLLYADGHPRTAADLSIAIHDDPERAADLSRVELLMRGLTHTLRGDGSGRRWIEHDEHGYRLVRD